MAEVIKQIYDAAIVKSEYSEFPEDAKVTIEERGNSLILRIGSSSTRFRNYDMDSWQPYFYLRTPRPGERVSTSQIFWKGAASPVSLAVSCSNEGEYTVEVIEKKEEA